MWFCEIPGVSSILDLEKNIWHGFNPRPLDRIVMRADSVWRMPMPWAETADAKAGWPRDQMRRR
jgi:hypothetical protein